MQKLLLFDFEGLWRYEDEKEGSSVYKTTIIKTAKELMCYSDFPIPKHFANFMHHSKVMEYFRLYAKELSKSKKKINENLE